MGPQLPRLSLRGAASQVHCRCINSGNVRIQAAYVHSLHGLAISDVPHTAAGAALQSWPSVGGQLHSSRCCAARQPGSSSSSGSGSGGEGVHRGWPLQAAASNHQGSSTAQAQCSSRPDSSRSSSYSASSGQAHQQPATTCHPSSKGDRINGNGSTCSSQYVGAFESNAQLSGAAIMRQLKATRSWQELQQLVQQHSKHLNWKHASALLTHLAQLTKATGTYTTQISQMQQQQQEQQQQQQPDNSANLAPSGSSVQDSGVQQLVASIMQLVDSQIEQCDPRGLSNTIWAAARLQHLAAGAALQQQQQQQQRLLSKHWLGRFCSICQPLLQQFDMQQLSNTLWALVNLQHSIPHAWLQDWYAAVSVQLHTETAAAAAAARQGRSSASSSSSSSGGFWELQAVASALWSVTQLPVSSRPTAAWLTDVLTVAAAKLQESSSSGNTGSASSSSTDAQTRSHRRQPSISAVGQAVSSLLWACAQLQLQPPAVLLEACTSWLQDLSAAGLPAHSQLGDQSLANMMWALAKLKQQQQQQQQHEDCIRSRDQERRESGSLCSTSSSTSSSSRHSKRSTIGRNRIQGGAENEGVSSSSSSSGTDSILQLVSGCSSLLLQMSFSRLHRLSGQHLSVVVWAAGALQLQPTSSWLALLQQQLATNAAGLSDQQVANILCGLSQLMHARQMQQQCKKQGRQQEQQQQQQQSRVLEQLLQAQQPMLITYGGQALSSSLLSAARLGVKVSEPLLQAWLREIARRSYLAGAGGRAMTDSCCALARIRQTEAAAAGPGRSSVSSAFQQQGPDTEWLTGFCTASVSRLGSFSGDELAGLGWALAALRFRPPVPWLLAWHSALGAKAGSLSVAAAGKALRAVCDLPAGPVGTSKEAVARQLLEALTHGNMAALDAQGIAVAAACIAAVYKGWKAAAATNSSSSSKGSRGAPDQLPSSSSSSSLDAQTALQRLLVTTLPCQVQQCNSQQLVVVLSAAAAARVLLPRQLLLAALHRLQQLAEQQQLDSAGSAKAVAAVAKLAGISSSRGSLAGQQQQQQESVSNTQPEQFESSQVQQQQQQRSGVSRCWVLCMLKSFCMRSAGPAELSLLLWSLAVLDHNPGTRWMAGWLKYSQNILHSFTPGQLASCGWALVVLNHVPNPSWQAAWLQGSGLQAAAAKPSEQALMLYAAAALGRPVQQTWLRSFALLAASSIRRWSVRDMSMGLWGLAQLGLRAVADGEVLEVLSGHMVAVTAGGNMESLTPHQQLQLLQAAVLLRQPTAGEEAAALCQNGKTQQQRQQQQQQLHGQQLSKSAVRQMRWRAKTAADSATAAAASARAAVMQHQQLLQLQQRLARQQLSSSSSSRSESAAVAAAVAEAAASAQQALTAWEAAVDDAAAAAAAVVTATTGRSPDAAGLPVDESWLLAWCKATLPQLHKWTPSVAAAALSAVACLGSFTPPVAWQRQLLVHLLQQAHHLQQQEVNAISHALDMMRSPFKHQWLSQIQVSYTPCTAAAAAAAISNPQQQQQQQRSKRRRKLVRLRHMPWRKGMSGAAAFDTGGSRQGQSCSARYPQQLTGYQLGQQRRQHRAARLASWWKRQQQLQRQRLLQQQWRSAAAAEAARSVWGSPAAASLRASFSSSNSSGSPYASYMQYSSTASFSASPASSMDPGPGVLAAASAPPSSAPGSVAGPSLESRKLSSSSLAPRPVRLGQVSQDAGGSSTDNVHGSSSSSSSSEDAAATSPAAAAAAAGVKALPDRCMLMAGSHETGSTQPDGSDGDATASMGSCRRSNSSHAVETDAAVVQAVWSSLAAAGVPLVNGSDSLDRSSVALSCSLRLSSMLQPHLSWACRSEWF